MNDSVLEHGANRLTNVVLEDVMQTFELSMRVLAELAANKMTRDPIASYVANLPWIYTGTWNYRGFNLLILDDDFTRWTTKVAVDLQRLRIWPIPLIIRDKLAELLAEGFVSTFTFSLQKEIFYLFPYIFQLSSRFHSNQCSFAATPLILYR